MGSGGVAPHGLVFVGVGLRIKFLYFSSKARGGAGSAGVGGFVGLVLRTLSALFDRCGFFNPSRALICVSKPNSRPGTRCTPNTEAAVSSLSLLGSSVCE